MPIPPSLATIGAVILQAQQRDPQLVAVAVKNRDSWKNISWPEYYKIYERVGAALKSLGLQTGDRVAILANTRFEWACMDLGCLGTGGVTVPIYHSNLADELEYIVQNSQAKFLICEDRLQYLKWQSVASRCPSVQKVICIEGEPAPQFLTWNEFLELGEQFLQRHPRIFYETSTNLNSDQIATIIYTSGTTGSPKGAVITHRQIMSEIVETFNLLHVSPHDISLTFLPYAHVLGRIELWGHLYKGFTMAYAESVDRLRQDMQEIKPTILIAVPRIFEKIHSGLLNMAEANPFTEKFFLRALAIGREARAQLRSKNIVSPMMIPKYLLAKRFVLEPIRQRLGGRLRFAICGGAPLNSEIAEFFHSLGILVLEGYGLTETTGAITVNTPNNFEFGTVGKPIGDVQIKIAEDGEVLVKSHKVMKEYYQNPDATAATFRDGYFLTGDIGEFTARGNLKITDRKKDLIKTAGGKYVAPQKIEGLLKLSPFVSNVHVHGDQRKYIVVLITLDRCAIENYAQDHGISYPDYPTLVQTSEIKNLVRDIVAETNEQLASFETVKNFAILPQDFTIESGELTPSLKVKRRLCDQKYAALIDKLYGLE